MQKVLHETCQQYVARRLSEGWRIISQVGFNVILQSPEGILRPVDLRNDVLTLRPNAAGDETSIPYKYPSSGGENWDRVDEAEADDAGTFIYTTTVGSYKRDLYNLPNHTTESGTINSVKIYFRIATPNLLYIAYAKPSQKSGTTVTNGTEQSTTGDTAYHTFSQTYTTNPATGVAYTWAEIDALQIGVSLNCNNTNGSRCTQVYVEVDYTAPTQAYKDIATRFKLTVRQFKDVATRFKLWVRNYKDTATRFKLWGQSFKDAATRFRLTVQNYIDAATRFKLWAQAYQDVFTRFKLWVQTYKDIATRFKLTVQGYQDTATRFRLNLGYYKDVATRFKLFVQGFQDAATRFKLTVQAYQDIATRFKLTVQGYKDIPTRFKLTVQNFRDVATRFRLTVQTFVDISTRFKLWVQGYRDIATRFRLWAQVHNDVTTRFRLVIPAYYPIIGGGHIIDIVGET